MSVYKEAMMLVAQIAKKQTQIYSDAADYGVPVMSFDDPAVKAAKQLEAMYFDPETDRREVQVYSTGTTIILHFTMVDEFGDGKEFPLQLIYVTTREDEKSNKHGRKGMKGILSVWSERWISAKDNKYFLK